MRGVLLLPFILLVWLGAWWDPHLFRYWDVHSIRHWQRSKPTWAAWAMAAAGWASLFCAVGSLYLLAR